MSYMPLQKVRLSALAQGNVYAICRMYESRRLIRLNRHMPAARVNVLEGH